MTFIYSEKSGYRFHVSPVPDRGNLLFSRTSAIRTSRDNATLERRMAIFLSSLIDFDAMIIRGYIGAS